MDSEIDATIGFGDRRHNGGQIVALHKDFPESPYAILDPSMRWFPADESLRETTMNNKLMPPLLPQLRRKVKESRDTGPALIDTNGRSVYY
jgi:hypothetical protein